ncbi:MAG: Hpt domain-containing protein [Candidatus Thiodiazotropha sp. (ex Epidulcina cf. delphinae)]|nr:Hpt domain-containing protein [Candidatus Thiodiazotropha sp. (ex Epidulcina cf. delphinae)]
MSNAQDFGALNWVKDELDVSIRHARQALEAHVESPGDGASLASCGDHLHQIARVLQMVQVYGPSMLAEEMELVVRDMGSGSVRQEEDAAEALMLALIQLPDYLEKLQGGDADIPLIILPLLNDLRAVRDAPLLSEAALFKPEIDTDRTDAAANIELPLLVKRVRQKFHLGLLSWYRKRDTVHGWPLLRDVFATLHQHAGTETVHHLFWVAEGLMRGLIEGAIAPGIAVKQLFSRLDRKMKLIIDDGEQALVANPPSALLKNLLYYIARAQSEDPLINEVKAAYNLDAVMPSEAQLTEGRLGLTGSNAELAESIKDAVSSELTRIKDILDLFMRDERTDMEMLGHLEAPIRKLADTLGMIGQGALRSRLNRQADKVKTFVEQAVLPEEFELMEMAGDILYVESSLSTLHTFQPGVDEGKDEGDLGLDMPEGEYQNLIKQTVREAKVEIARAKEAIISFTESTDDSSVLSSVHQGFKRVEGALNMLNLREAAQLMSQTGEFIQSSLIDSGLQPQRQQLNSLADVVSSIEYYLETLVDGAGDRREILAIAQASLNDLVSEGGVEISEYTEPTENIDLAESADHAEGYELEEEDISDLELGASSLQIEPPQPEVDILSGEVSELFPAAGEKEPEPEAEIASADKPMLEDIDPEILEIFIEEAREELETIQEYLPKWQHNQGDGDALITFRRSFHTLKGSGRLVGAKVIGELAWSVENMLNRLMDETIKVSPEMMALLNRMVEALPELIDCQERGEYPNIDIEFLQHQAYALADGKPMPSVAPVAEIEPVQLEEEAVEQEQQLEAGEAVAESSASEPELELELELELEPESDLSIDTEPRETETAQSIDEFSLDDEIDDSLLEEYTDSDLQIEVDTELLEVFAEESEDHLQEIEQFLQLAANADPAMLVPEEVVRACHTLHGSSHMAGITPIAMLSEAMEDYARVLFERHLSADAPVIELLDGSVGYIRKLLSWLPEESLPEPHIDTYLSRLGQALEQLQVDEVVSPEADSQPSEPAELSVFDGEEEPTEQEPDLEPLEEIPAADAEEAVFEFVMDETEETPYPDDSIEVTLEAVSEQIEPTDQPSEQRDQTDYSGEVVSDLRDEALFEVGEDAELVEIFIEEGRELLDLLEQNYHRWRESPEDIAVIDEIKRSLHTLKGSSRLAGIDPIGDLSHGLESLFDRVLGEKIAPEPPIRNLARQALDMLATQIEDAATTGKVRQSSLLLSDLENPTPPPAEEAEMPDKTEEPPSEEPQQEPQTAEAVTEGDETSTLHIDSYYEEPLSFPHEGERFEVSEDRELVEIFVEESRELLESLEESFRQWSDNPSDHHALDGMQRALHTIKGSSRLAGIEPVGDLSHAMESLLNGVIRGQVAADEKVLNISRLTLDLLATQTEDTDATGKVHRADALIEEIQSIIDRSASQEQEREDLIDPDLQEELDEASETVAEEAIDETAEESGLEPDSDEPVIPVERFDIEDIADDALEQGDDSFILLHDEVLLDVGEDEELVQVFIEEAKEFIEQIENNFQHWLEDLEDHSSIEGVQRNLHTLKGSARLAGIMPVGDLSHAIESLMTAVAEEEIDPIVTVTDAARYAMDHLAFQIDTIAKTGKVPASDTQVEQLHNLLGGDLTPPHSELVETIQTVQEPDSEPVEEVNEAPPSAKVLPFNDEIAKLLNPEKDEDKASFKPNKEQVRVNADLMDRLVNHAGEVSIYRSRLEQQNSVLGFNLSELEQTVSRLFIQLRNLEIETEAQIIYRWEREHEKDDRERAEFDPLELDRFSTMQQLSRALVETVNDLGNINEALRDLQRETDTLLLQQSRISTDLQDGLLRTRMVPFAQLVPRMQRLVRQTAGQLNKKANLECFGIEGELDRSILNRMVPVLEHLLRNSVSHGIEFPQDRLSTGKKETGRISLYVDREATDVLITLSDDGKGLDIEAIRKRALDQGMIDAAVEISDDDLIQCVLLPGFSTAKEVTQISGRGVGLDVVTSEVKQLGGSLEIDSHPGRGTSFIIRLPLTLAITDALLVRVGEEIYAIPHGSISGVVRIRRQALQACYSGQEGGFDYGGKRYKVDYLGRMMGTGLHEIHEATRWYPLLLLQTGEHQAALQVDELLGSRQVVVKSLGKQVGSVRWITGGTILADGRVALILDLASLVRMDATHAMPAPVFDEAPQKRLEDRLRVMVVDDSITVRKVTSRLLERHDMDVVTAKDGVEAVTLLQEQVPDVMLLDIEMPRMDGFELARHINNSVEYYGLPIIMISSRVGDKHRQRAMDLGVKRCLGKPYQESELLENINEVLAESKQ